MMRTNRVPSVTSSAVAGLLWIVGPWAAAQHQHPQPADRPPQASAPAPQEKTLKVGKKDDVEFHVETIVGDLKLKPGRYQIQHRVEGSDHFVHFTELTKGNPYWRSGGGAPKAHPGEIKCRLEPLEKKVSATAVVTVREGEAARVTRVLIGGENVAHVF